MTRGNELSRRAALGAAAGGTLDAALPPVAAAGRRRVRHRRADVVVVGAGLAGITAARDLVQRGASVIVLEAKSRVGGRAYSEPVGDGHAAERGAEGLQQTHTQFRVVELAKEVGLKPVQKRPAGNNVYVRRGRRTLYDRRGPLGRIPPDVVALADAARAVTRLEQMSKELPPERPWTHPQALEWDSQTLDSFLKSQGVGEDGQWFIALGTQVFNAALPRDLSLLNAIANTARLKTEPTPPRSKLQEMLETTGTWRFPTGVQSICVRHAERLGIGRRVILDSPVRRISQNRRGVRVVSDRMIVSARYAIVTPPAPVTRVIDYDPPLPPHRAMLLQRYPMGSVIKCHAVYDRPFWRDDGLTGEAFSDGSPVVFCSDETPASGAPGVIYAYVAAHHARQLVQRPRSERRAAVLANLAQFYGPEALQPRRYFDTAWANDPWPAAGRPRSRSPGRFTTTAMRSPRRPDASCGRAPRPPWSGPDRSRAR